MVSTAMMGLAELAQFLVSSGTYSTLAEAMAALNLVVIEDVGVAGTAIAVQGGAAEAVIGTIGETALEVAAQAELAATGTNVTTAGIGLLEGSGGTLTTGAILGVDLGIVGAAVAPLLGVSLGVTMYESNPELWTKISQKLLPFCYPGTTTIPTWGEIINDAWQVSVAKSIIDAIKELFEEENIHTYNEYAKTDQTGSIAGVSPSAFNNFWRNFYGGNRDWHVDSVTGEGVIYYGNETGEFYVPNGTTIVWRTSDNWNVTWNSGWKTVSVTQYTPIGTNPYTDQQIVDIADGNGDVEVIEPADGVSEWTGTTPSEIPESKPAVIGSDPQTGNPITQPMVPISFPEEVPQVDPAPEVKPSDWPEELPSPIKVGSPDPEVQPNPTEVTDPEKQVQPYIQPFPIPWDVTNPDQRTETDPTLDPTRPRPPIQTITNPPVDLGPEPIGMSPWPSMPATPNAFPLNGSAGLITVYHPTPSQLYAFCSWLWVTLSQASIQTVWNNPFDGVITLFELYCTPTDNGHRTIHSGFLDSGIDSATISRYTDIDCGTIGIPEYYGNYLDYSPYSKAHIYLPFIGIQELNVDDIVGHAVNVTYRIDEYNGSCIAMITVAKVTKVNGEDVEYSNTMYQYSGNCAVELPISGGNQSSILAGMMTANAYQQASQISAGAQLIGGIASTIGGLLSLNAGGIGGGISQMVGAAATQAYGQAQALSNMLSGKSTVQKSGQFGSSHGALGIKTPFIVVTRPKQIQVPNYEDLYGFPAHKMVTIGSCRGFLRCREAHIISATANDEEKSIIESMLKSGVYVTE